MYALTSRCPEFGARLLDHLLASYLKCWDVMNSMSTNVTYLLRGKGPASPPPPPRLLPSPGAWARFNRKNLLLPNASHLSSHILSYLSWFIRSDLQSGLLFLQCWPHLGTLLAVPSSAAELMVPATHAWSLVCWEVAEIPSRGCQLKVWTILKI